MTEKRGRGRPTGSGKDDLPHLRKVADLLIENPTMKPTTGINRVIWAGKWTETEATLRRRWQVKWKVQGASLISEARQTREARQQQQARPYNHHPAYLGLNIGQALKTVEAIDGIGTVIRKISLKDHAVFDNLRVIKNPQSTEIQRLNNVGIAMRQMNAAIQANNQATQLGRVLKAHSDAKKAYDIAKELTRVTSLARLIGGKG